jgi:GABA(A) receptor-associated protein
MPSFKDTHPFEKRKEISDKFRNDYPDRVPIIVEPAPNCRLPPLNKKKFLVPEEISVGKFVVEIRKHIKLDASQAIFLFVDNTIPTISHSIRHLDQKYKDPDGFLYLVYSGENTFG